MLNLMQSWLVGLLLEIDPTAVNRFLLTQSRRLPGAPKGMTARTFQNKRYFGMVIADKALKPGKPLGKCMHVQAMHQRFVGGMDWNQTEYSKLYEKKYRSMARRGGEGSSFEVFANEKLSKYDTIFEDIKINGYKQSASIEKNIEVALDANGEVLLIDGRHRLILAQLIGLKKIPVVVNLVAESFVKSFIELSGATGNNVLLNPDQRYRFGVFVAQLIGLKRNHVSADIFVESCSKLLASDAESLRSQLLCQNVIQRLNGLCVVPGGFKNKGVLVNAHQRNHFSS